MQIKRIIYRLKELGPKGTILRIQNRMHKKIFSIKAKFAPFLISPSLNQIKKNSTFQLNFIEELEKNKFFLELCPENIFNKKWIITTANKFLTSGISLLGTKISLQKIENFDWQNGNPTKGVFFQDIDLITLTKIKTDLKIAWEISRFNYVVIIAKAYKLTQNEKYSQFIINLLISWFRNNKFLYGINWTNPMEVAIRAINFLWICYFCKENKNFKKIENQINYHLYEHLIFLENNWEKSDRPNNHYLADLLGYLYLTEFFNLKSKFNNALKEMVAQLKVQIQDDGSSYEGSTCYHRLVTEIFLHTMLLPNIPLEIKSQIKEKFLKMLKFLQANTPIKNEFLQIGDNDSGKIVFGIDAPPIKTKNQIYNFPNFGLTILKYQQWYIAFRNPSYHTKQPTGHFHEDFLSITIYYQGKPIIIDPGTYTYTGNIKMRNIFRSTFFHNNPIKKSRILHTKETLFQLPLEKTTVQPQIKQNANRITIKNSYDLHSRKLILEKNINTITIKDSYKKEKGNEACFIFHPERKIFKKPRGNKYIWLIDNMLEITTNVTFEKKKKFYSPEYGVKEKSFALIRKQQDGEAEITIKIKPLKQLNHTT